MDKDEILKIYSDLTVRIAGLLNNELSSLGLLVGRVGAKEIIANAMRTAFASAVVLRMPNATSDEKAADIVVDLSRVLDKAVTDFLAARAGGVAKKGFESPN